MKLTLLTHENTVGKEIANELSSGNYSDFKVAVAYTRNSGISRIYNELSGFANNGGTTSVIAGIDQRNTSYQGLINLKTFAKENLFVHHDINSDITFHPKIYLFGNKTIEKVIIGSSNFTAGGFFLNYEANIGVTLDSSENSRVFRRQVCDYWKTLLQDVNTTRCDLPLLGKLLQRGLVVDEQKQKPFKDIISNLSKDLPFTARKRLGAPTPVAEALGVTVPSVKEVFAMSLSGFDVSQRSQDPVILIPITALKAMPMFWNFPILYTNSGAGYPQLYATANIRIDRRLLQDQHIRIYYYARKKEFRLQCEAIKRNGKQGDIILIRKHPNIPLQFDIELLRTGSINFKAIEPRLTTRVSSQKLFTYY